MQIEFRRKRFRKRPRAGMSRVNERAIDVEENQPNHAGKYQIPGIAARILRERFYGVFNVCD
jgi:hypothetical protein